MFTGIVSVIGKIVSVKPQSSDVNAGVHLVIEADDLWLHNVALGDSISVNGACMTVVEKMPKSFMVDVSRESLNCTVGLATVGEVNLEKALTLAERLGGHLVSGHVDGVGVVKKFESIGESWELIIQAPRDLAKYFSYKASVVIHGVSLTINHVEDTEDACLFSINLIPHTIRVTTLKHLQVGKQVNIEVDMIARYVERILMVTK